MTDQDNKIRERAHALWEQAGRPEGRDLEHWQQARNEIESEAGSAGSEAPGSGTGRKKAGSAPAEAKPAQPVKPKKPVKPKTRT